MQKDEDANNKWHSIVHLGRHVLTYTFFFSIYIILGYSVLVEFKFETFIGFRLLLTWFAINGVLHFITDYYTSKMTHYLWEEKRVRAFFHVIGLDQFIHYLCLFGTYYYLTV
jgi:hypothetical protein